MDEPDAPPPSPSQSPYPTPCWFLDQCGSQVNDERLFLSIPDSPVFSAFSACQVSWDQICEHLDQMHIINHLVGSCGAWWHRRFQKHMLQDSCWVQPRELHQLT